jgi:2-polyprenyl-6-hydroxyphenyl methylase/3-demethylubiquinone-9 3-methyltransferase
MSDKYYSEKLAAERLQRVYDLAPPRIRQYLQAEIDFVLERMIPGAAVLELGCGFGRVLGPLANEAGMILGIDTSLTSLNLARRVIADHSTIHLACMDASRMGLRDRSFDLVVCIQNGISAFHVDQSELIREAVRVTRRGGVAMFSSYSARFWDVRLDWFERQAQLGLVGEIDREKTGNGVLVCKDGFRATTVDAHDFRRLTDSLKTDVEIVEVDQSSIFCIISP